MSPEAAYQCIRTKTKSCEPLAILVVGSPEQLRDFGESYAIPAHGPNNVPLIIQASLVQFGDSPITFKMQIPSVNIESSATTTIEFCIIRSQVADWTAVQVPLHYVGVQVSSLRGNNLQATWAIRPCDQDRKPVPHKSAHHYHGFFQISDTLLEVVLGRSGNAGLYFMPKTAQHKHDPRYGVINLPGKALNDVLQKANQCANTLGVVCIGEGYGIRAKREHLDAVRAVLLPETAYVECNNCEEDEDMYTISHVPQITRENLGVALERAGWDARVIRALGNHKWAIASKQQPQVSHLAINGYIAIIERQTSRVAKHSVAMIAREMKVDTVIDQTNHTISTTSRFAEIKTHMETQIEQVLENKLRNANSRIEALTCALQDMQSKQDQVQQKVADDMGQIREEQAFAKQKLQEVESTVASSSGAIIAQMQQMFTSMQCSLEKTLADSFAQESEKRPRLEPPAKIDPFASKS